MVSTITDTHAEMSKQMPDSVSTPRCFVEADTTP